MPYVTDLLRPIGNGGSILGIEVFERLQEPLLSQSSHLFRTVLIAGLSVNVLRRKRVMAATNVLSTFV